LHKTFFLRSRFQRTNHLLLWFVTEKKKKKKKKKKLSNPIKKKKKKKLILKKKKKKKKERKKVANPIIKIHIKFLTFHIREKKWQVGVQENQIKINPRGN